MDAAEIRWLQTPEGIAAAVQAAALLAAGPELPALRRLGRDWTPAQARAAVALVLGRRTLAGKRSDAARLFCDREAGEQASHASVAMHLAARFAGSRYVADIGCGMGGDALAIAMHAPVLAIDRDETRLAMLAANVSALGLSDRVTPLLDDAETWTPPPDIDALWCDPARRGDSERRLRPEQWSPSLARALTLAVEVGAAGIKLAPGIDLDALPEEGEGCEVEFVSLDRGLRAAVLWLGRLARAPRTATVLSADGAVDALSGEPDDGATPLGEPGRYLYDLDPAVGRAGLLDLLAPRLNAWKLDSDLAYLTSEEAVETPFARRFLVLDWLPFAERGLLDALRRLDTGRVDVMRRGSPVDTNALERRLNAALRGRGNVAEGTADSEASIVVLTRVRGVHVAIVCTRE